MKLSYFHQHIIPSCTYYYIVLSDFRYLISFKCNKLTSYGNMCTCVLRMHTSECLRVNMYKEKAKVNMRPQTSHVHFAMSSSRQNNSTTSCTYYYIVLSDLYLGFPIAKYTLKTRKEVCPCT
jgi:hypothetical protein